MPRLNREVNQEYISKVFVFIVSLKSEFDSWYAALSSYVINNEKVEHKYRILNQLGQGSFGYVLLA